MNLAWWLEHAALEDPQRDALIEGRTGGRLTYGQLRDRSDAIAGALRDEADIQPGDVVATIMPDDLWHTAVFYGLIRLGAVFSGFNRTLSARKFAMDVERSRVRTLVVGADYLGAARQLQQETCVEQILVCDEPGDHGLPDLRELAAQERAPAHVVARTEADLAAVNFTGGTSGVAKGVEFTHGKLGLSAQASVFYDQLASRDTNMSCISLYHSGGIQDAVKWVMAGATNLLTGGWQAELAARLIAEYRPTWISFWVPTMVRDLMRRPEWDGLPLDGMRAVLAGEAVPVDLQRTLEGRGMRVSNAYGMTETMPVAILKPITAHGDVAPPGSCGRPCPELLEVVLKDPETGERVDGRDEPGEVCVRGDVVTPGYHNDPERTADAFDDEGFLHTRDLASVDAEGWYWLAGRTDDIINTGAEKLSLTEIEDLLREHPAVDDVGCIGVAHERFGEVPAAFVVSSSDEDELASVLDEHCAGVMERWKRPRLYGRVEEIPRTMPKRTKDLQRMRGMVEGIELREDDGVVTLSAAKGA